MLEILFDKIAEDPQYLAWYFSKYMDIEKKTFPQLFKQLNINDSGFFKLSMCKVSPTNHADFSLRLKRIAEFATINVFPLIQIIRSVESSISFDNADAINVSLMAARLKDSNDNDEVNDVNEEL